MMSATGFHIMYNDLHRSWLKVASPIRTRIFVRYSIENEILNFYCRTILRAMNGTTIAVVIGHKESDASITKEA